MLFFVVNYAKCMHLWRIFIYGLSLNVLAFTRKKLASRSPWTDVFTHTAQFIPGPLFMLLYNSTISVSVEWEYLNFGVCEASSHKAGNFNSVISSTDSSVAELSSKPERSCVLGMHSEMDFSSSNSFESLSVVQATIAIKAMAKR